MKRGKKKKIRTVKVVIPNNSNNPAYLTWEEILNKYNKGNIETIFGKIIL